MNPYLFCPGICLCASGVFGRQSDIRTSGRRFMNRRIIHHLNLESLLGAADFAENILEMYLRRWRSDPDAGKRPAVKLGRATSPESINRGFE